MGNLYRVTVAMSYDGETALNVHYYWTASTARNAVNLAILFTGQVINRMRTFQTAQNVYQWIKVQNHVDASDVYVLGLTEIVGTDGSVAPLPAQNCITVALGAYAVNSLSPNHGWKRYAGLGRDKVSGRDLISGTLTKVSAFLPILYSALTDPNNVVYYHMIVRVLDWVSRAYSASPVLTASYSKLGSQDSRQNSRTGGSYLALNDEVNTLPFDLDTVDPLTFGDAPIVLSRSYLESINFLGVSYDGENETVHSLL